MEVLYKLRKEHPGVFKKTEGMWYTMLFSDLLEETTAVYIDGGVRRGTGR